MKRNFFLIGLVLGCLPAFTFGTPVSKVGANSKNLGFGNNYFASPLPLFECVPLNPPAGISSASTSESITITWQAVPDATGYEIRFSDNSNLTPTTRVYPETATSRTFSGLSPLTTYYYSIKAINNNNTADNSDFSNQMSAATLPTKPSVTSFSGKTLTGFTVSWENLCSSCTVVEYFLDVATDNAFTNTNFIQPYNNFSMGTTTTLTLTGMGSNTTYYVRVRVKASRANGVEGTSLSSDVKSITLDTAAPTTISATNITATTFTANWNLVSNPSNASYLLDVSSHADFSDFLSGYHDLSIPAIPAGTGSKVVSGLTPLTAYYYRVRARGVTTVVSGYSPVMPVTTTVGVPVASRATSVTATSFVANWSSVTGATSYEIDVSAYLDFHDLYPLLNNTSTSTNLTVSLSTSSSYTFYYRVRAKSSASISEYSNTISVTTKRRGPDGGTATNITAASFTVIWTPETDATATYFLDVARADNFSSSSLLPAYTDFAVSGSSCTITGLSANTTYYCRIRSVLNGETSDNSTTIPATTLLATPTNVSVSETVKTDGFTIQWPRVSGASGYDINVSTSQDFPSNSSSTISNITNLTYEASYLAANTQYFYRVKATSSSNFSEFSTIGSVYTRLRTGRVSPATVIRATSFTANWGDVSGATSYQLDVATDQSFSQPVAGYNDLTVSGTSCSVTNLTPSTQYFYRVRAKNNNTTSENSAFTSLSTATNAPVANPATGITNNGFMASWSEAAGSRGYYFQVATDENFTETVNSYDGVSAPSRASSTSAQITGLNQIRKCYFRVRSYIEYEGDKIYSDYSNVIVVFIGFGAPTPTEATNKSASGFTANWTAVAGATAYLLDVADDSNFSNILLDYTNVSVNAVSKDITGLQPYKFYSYRVRAQMGAFTSGYSPTKSVRTLLNAPVANPAVASATSFRASWSLVSDASNYLLDVSSSKDFTTFVGDYSDKTIGNQTSWDINEVSNKTIYYYRVRAKNGPYISAYSNVISVNDARTAIKDDPSERAQVYPNPATENVTFSFLSDNENIVLTLFDNSGKELTQLINTYFDKGKHEWKWNVADRQGLFFWMLLHANGRSEVGKIVVIP